MSENQQRSTIDRIFDSAAPSVVAMATLSIVGLLWSLQAATVEIKASQARVLEIAKETANQLVDLEERVRNLELKTAK